MSAEVSSPVTHLIKPGTPISDMRLRCGLSAYNAGESALLGSDDGLQFVDCAGCLRDLIVDMRVESTGAASPEERWPSEGDTGTSSLTVWSVMTGRPMPGGRAPDVPVDPSDFGRCHRLLERFPAWRARLGEVAAKHPDWGSLVGAWDELTDIYLAEAPSGVAPRLYARMEEIR